MGQAGRRDVAGWLGLEARPEASPGLPASQRQVGTQPQGSARTQHQQEGGVSILQEHPLVAVPTSRGEAQGRSWTQASLPRQTAARHSWS